MTRFNIGDRIAYRRRHVLSAWYIGTIIGLASSGAEDFALVTPDGAPAKVHTVNLSEPDRTEVRLTLTDPPAEDDEDEEQDEDDEEPPTCGDHNLI